ncbi:MAG: 4-(cytidine 5'-diphospho)-2-C-methyl-D-erythritol kinase [Acidobacteria bacterium]|nr:4-(cytidine 5'-diphospho)-2-C-methyl-D-erythritol kinase [Acidobacteriota bacterium]
MKRIELCSFAKINLFLKVGEKRDDGYHEIRTLYQTISLCDLITIERRQEGIEFSSNEPRLPVDERNLAVKAAKLFLDRVGIRLGVRIEIKKRIPLAAGLAGGSSNAATVLLGMNRLFDVGLSKEELFPLARLLGADAPFFLMGGAVLGSGRGDELRPLEFSLPFPYIVLLSPDFEISTAWAYNEYDKLLTRKRKEINMNGLLLGEGKKEILLFNDLERVVEKSFPELSSLKEELRRKGAKGALMSGSGPSLFGLFSERKEAVEAVAFFKERMRVFLTTPLLRDEYVKRMFKDWK